MGTFVWMRKGEKCKGFRFFYQDHQNVLRLRRELQAQVQQILQNEVYAQMGTEISITDMQDGPSITDFTDFAATSKVIITIRNQPKINIYHLKVKSFYICRVIHPNKGPRLRRFLHHLPGTVLCLMQKWFKITTSIWRHQFHRVQPKFSQHVPRSFQFFNQLERPMKHVFKRSPILGKLFYFHWLR